MIIGMIKAHPTESDAKRAPGNASFP